MFKIGQKVVCMNDAPGYIDGCKFLIKNNIYIIEDILNDEIKVLGDNGFWFANRFRPLDYDIISNKDIIGELTEEKADIEIKEPIKQE